MLNIKVWCLPAEWSEKEFCLLHNKLVQSAIEISELGIKSEKDMLNLFPQDRMMYGLGTEILVEISGIKRAEGIQHLFSFKVGEVLKDLLPNSNIIVEFGGKTYYDSRKIKKRRK